MLWKGKNKRGLLHGGVKFASERIYPNRGPKIFPSLTSLRWTNTIPFFSVFFQNTNIQGAGKEGQGGRRVSLDVLPSEKRTHSSYCQGREVRTSPRGREGRWGIVGIPSKLLILLRGLSSRASCLPALGQNVTLNFDQRRSPTATRAGTQQKKMKNSLGEMCLLLVLTEPTPPPPPPRHQHHPRAHGGGRCLEGLWDRRKQLSEEPRLWRGAVSLFWSCFLGSRGSSPHCLLSSYPPLGFQDPHTVPRWSAVPSIVALPNGHLPKYLLEAASSLCHLFPLYTMVYHKLILAFSSNPFIPLLQDPALVPGPSMGWMRKPGPA